MHIHRNNHEQMCKYKYCIHACTHTHTSKHAHAHIIHIFCLSNEINHWGNLICKSRRKSALKPQKESSFRRRLMVGMMELMEHCMPREKKSDLQLYIDTYSLFLKQSTDSLLSASCCRKHFDVKGFCIFTFVCCLLLFNLISYLHK